MKMFDGARTLLLVLGSAASAAGQTWTIGETLEPGFPVATTLIGDVDGDSKAELVVVGLHGEVHVWTGRGASTLRATLPQPKRVLVTLAKLAATDSFQHLLTCGEGTSAYDLRGEGDLAEPRRLARRASFPFRSDRPRTCDFARDLNGDGLVDLVVPWLNEIVLWTQERDADGEPGFRKTARFPIDTKDEESLEARHLSDQLSVSYVMPDLDLRDIDGDSRKDLVVEEGDRISFYRQRVDGGLPESPDLVLELEHFRDTTPEAGVRLGEAMQGEKKPRAVLRDLDGDGRLDFVTFHLRKIQVYHGDERGPQQDEPTQILRVAEDVTRVEIANLDDDDVPDLMLIRVEVPSIATLFAGLFAEWDIGITILDYRGLGKAGFEKEVRRRVELTLRLPAISSLITKADEYVLRMEEAGQKLRTWEFADFDGDGTNDVAIVSEDRKRLDVWLGTGGDDRAEERDQLFKEIVFEGGDSVWTVDRMLALFGDLASRRALRMTGGKQPTASVALRSPDQVTNPDLRHADLDGDGKQELLVSYERLGKVGALVIDVVGWR
ncbi:MAG: VCBS repeat-containing protein [Planctomycetes bacterium]|nr:VCBS repeat-containing protein [Planctomycetota bacterium]